MHAQNGLAKESIEHGSWRRFITQPFQTIDMDGKTGSNNQSEAANNDSVTLIMIISD